MFRIGRSDRIRPIIPVVFFLSPLVASAVPRLTWLFFLLIATLLIVPALGREGAWRQLTEPNAPLVALLLLLLYVFLNATWAVDRGVAIDKASLLLGIVLITFVASRAMANWDKFAAPLCRSRLCYWRFSGALFVLFEMLTQGALTRFAMNSIAPLHPGNPKHMRISEGQVTKISLSELNLECCDSNVQFVAGTILLKKGWRWHAPCGSYQPVPSSGNCSRHPLRASIVASGLVRLSIYLFASMDVAQSSHTHTRDRLVLGFRLCIATQSFRLQG